MGRRDRFLVPIFQFIEKWDRNPVPVPCPHVPLLTLQQIESNINAGYITYIIAKIWRLKWTARYMQYSWI
jgi:hypothetical protein